MVEADRIDIILSALANRARREIVMLLAQQGNRPVQDLADHFDMARPSVSEHLKVLRDVGLVVEEKAGRQRLYSLRGQPLAELRDWLDDYRGFWSDKMAGLRAVLDENE